MNSYIDYNISHDSQDVETAWVPADGWMNKYKREY